MGYRIQFEGLESYIDEDQFQAEEMDVNFGGSMMVKFENTGDKFIAVNAVDGYGNNIADEVKGKEAQVY